MQIVSQTQPVLNLHQTSIKKHHQVPHGIAFQLKEGAQKRMATKLEEIINILDILEQL